MSTRMRLEVGLIAALCAWAGVAGAADELSDKVRTEIAAKVPGAKPDDIGLSPVDGLYEVALGAFIAYVSKDGRYLINGDVYELASKENITEARRNGARVTALAKLDEKQMIIFSPEHPKHTITVFTDVDCAYCRKLHSEIAKLNGLGVRVRYLAYPRSGPDTPSWEKAEAVWCAADRQDAITRAKKGETIARAADCKDTPIASDYELGEEMGVRGTPAIITETGEYLGGYLPPEQLVKYLDQVKSEKVARVP
jgi:thiol:disulfide interchange protein DsbC